MSHTVRNPHALEIAMLLCGLLITAFFAYATFALEGASTTDRLIYGSVGLMCLVTSIGSYVSFRRDMAASRKR